MGAAMEIRAPLEQEGTKSVVRKWLKQVGDKVRIDEPIVELETDKVAVEVAAEAEGVLAEILLAPGDDAGPGAVLGRLESLGAAQSAEPTAASAKTAEPVAPRFDWPSHPAAPKFASFDPELRLSPSVRRLLMETGLDPTGLQGKGRGGRLTRKDVEEALAGRGSAPAQAKVSASAGGVRVIPHDGMRKRIAEHMVHSLSTAPHVTAVFEADFSAIAAHRRAHKAAFEAKGMALTYTAYLVAASAQAMAAAPAVNSRWYEDRLEVFEDVDVGVGTALADKGLIVPVIREAQALSLFEIAQKLQDLTERARAGKLTPADVKGGTFSISNHGVSGSLLAAPIIINQPQSAILGVGKLEKRVVVREIDGAEAMLIRPMAYVTLTIDHRAIDGHQTNAWLTRFVEVLQGWS